MLELGHPCFERAPFLTSIPHVLHDRRDEFDGDFRRPLVAAQHAKYDRMLASLGATLADVAKTLCFLTDMDTFATFNEAYVAGFGTSRPARTTIGVAALPLGAAVEIETVAGAPETVVLICQSPSLRMGRSTVCAKAGVKKAAIAKPAKIRLGSMSGSLSRLRGRAGY